MEPVDVNLALFELLGRLAIRGIWAHHHCNILSDADERFTASQAEIIKHTLDTIVSLINFNPTLNTPIKDDHMIEIALVMYLAQMTASELRFLSWIESISEQTTFALIANSQYPTCYQDYNDLLYHPASNDQAYLDEACAGSILYPFIYCWMHRSSDEVNRVEFTKRLELKIPNCTHQAWFPDDDTDSAIWCGDKYHGICVTDLSPHDGYKKFAESLDKAVETCTAISEISANSLGLTPLFLTACRHYRLPISPNFWIVRSS